MFFLGLGVNCLTNINIVLIQESVDHEFQYLPGMVYCIYCGLACGVASLISYNFQNWWTVYQIVGSFAGLVTIAMIFLLPESTRWSKVEKKHDEKALDSIKQLFRSKMFVKRLVLSVPLWSAANVIYYGFALNLGTLSGSIYMNTTINGFIEIIGYTIIPVLFLNKLGRIKTLMIILSLMIICALAGLILDNWFLDHKTTIKAVRYLGALLDCSMFPAIYTHTAELFPTNIRGQGLSIPDGLS